MHVQVDFGYDVTRPILSGLSFDVPAGRASTARSAHRHPPSSAEAVVLVLAPGWAGITFVVVFLHNVVVFLHNVVATDCRSASLTAQRSDQTVALVGGTGSGKSTILRLLYRFYDAHQGRVLVDSQDVRTIDMRSLRQLLGERAPMDQ
jgi:ABC-type transport system involved in Fe-S cluster assembly fused permease/ATPase subunit